MAATHSIHITSTTNDARATQLLRHLRGLSEVKLETVEVVDVYAIRKELTSKQLSAVAEMLTNPVAFSDDYASKTRPELCYHV